MTKQEYYKKSEELYQLELNGIDTIEDQHELDEKYNNEFNIKDSLELEFN